METEAGQKRKEFKTNLKKYWHDWFGDYTGRIKILFYLALIGFISWLFYWFVLENIFNM